MEADFKAILAGHAALLEVIGINLGTGVNGPAAGPSIYPSAYAQGCLDPCIRYQKIAGGPGLHMQGSDGLSNDLVQIDIRGRTAASVIAVRDVLLGAHGTGGLLHPYVGIEGSTNFQLIRLAEGGDRGIRHEKPNDVDYYTASLDFRVWSRAA